MDESQRSALQALIEPVLAEEAMELVELSCRPQGRQLYIRLLVDRVGGVTIHHCARVNRLIGGALETANVIEESYTLEVSSPGLDRPLTNKRDFERAVGESVRVELQPVDSRHEELTGMVLAVQPEAVVVKTGSGNLTVPFAQIRRAVKVMKW